MAEIRHGNNWSLFQHRLITAWTYSFCNTDRNQQSLTTDKLDQLRPPALYSAGGQSQVLLLLIFYDQFIQLLFLQQELAELPKCLCLHQSRLARSQMFSTCLFVRPSVCYKTCEHGKLKINESFLVQIGTSSPRGKGMIWSTFEVRRLKVKVTWHKNRSQKSLGETCQELSDEFNQIWQAHIAILTWQWRFINHLLTYLLTYLQ